MKTWDFLIDLSREKLGLTHTNKDIMVDFFGIQLI